ncbi:hypothetical protein BDV36DRAFT_175708 [Aspergillus pseudocaelatus]|uniref:Uncharacterized protein n=1 Tax=Aspergillus pseudocaelatus TaxID=1825620 RepID=A0ABQ6WKC5_9EURO|nr:hypothetical protein BDV36DRAFT_175708 [Aspergillus pseudocaelatus]
MYILIPTRSFVPLREIVKSTSLVMILLELLRSLWWTSANSLSFHGFKASYWSVTSFNLSNNKTWLVLVLAESSNVMKVKWHFCLGITITIYILSPNYTVPFNLLKICSPHFIMYFLLLPFCATPHMQV